MEDLKSLLEDIYLKYNDAKFLESDPIEFPKKFSDPKDIEITAFFTALFSYGNVRSIKNHIFSLIKLFQGEPYRFLSDPKKIIRIKNKIPYYRFQNKHDNYIFFMTVSSLIQSKKGLEIYFGSSGTIGERISEFQKNFLKESKMFTKKISPGLIFLVGKGDKKSANKRYKMFLRWMVRTEFPDFGIYKTFKTSDLEYPVDAHIAKLSTILSLTDRKTADSKFSTEVTNFFRKISPNDPVRYDFPLTRLGILGECMAKYKKELCETCILKNHCKVYKKHHLTSHPKEKK